MTSQAPLRRGWLKSSFSNPSGNCVEVADHWTTADRPGAACVAEPAGRYRVRMVAVRNSRDPGGGHLHFMPADWAAFLWKIQAPSAGTVPGAKDAAAAQNQERPGTAPGQRTARWQHRYNTTEGVT